MYPVTTEFPSPNVPQHEQLFLSVCVLMRNIFPHVPLHPSSWLECVIANPGTGRGCLAGGAICGMHYLGNASISNYTCVYEPVNIIGATLIAVAASTVSLSLFFVFRASWTNSWWRRALSAVVLAGAVSGMHWCASTGTQYRLISLNSENSQSSRSSTVIVVICLSIGAAFITAGIAMYTAHVKRRYAHKAQQVVLAAAVFDKSGRILVSPDGLLPSEKITDTYIEKSSSDIFSIAHPLFHWMFQASRNWNGLSKIIGGMTTHLAHLPRRGKDNEVRLIDDNGELIQNYDTIFCELFCLAAMNLAEETKEQLTEAGILWDEILPTGTGGASRQRIAGDDKLLERDRYGRPRKISDDLIEKGEAWGGRHQEYGRGSLMFLIRCVERPQDVERLEAAGYRFADIHQVSGIIASSMQIKANDFEGKLTNMATYAGDNIMLDPGVHVGFFAVKARVGGLGFSIMVQKAARNLLPTVQMPLERLESWQVDIVRQLDQTRVPLLLEKLEALTMARSPQEKLFASQLQDAVEALQTWIDDPIFVEATLTSKLVQVPCRATAGTSAAASCTMISLHVVIPIHAAVHSPECEFVPLNFFKVHQMVYKNSPGLGAFTRSVHREIAPIINSVSAIVADLPRPAYQYKKGSRFGSLGDSLRQTLAWTSTDADDDDNNLVPTKTGRTMSGPAGGRSYQDAGVNTFKPWSRENSYRMTVYNDSDNATSENSMKAHSHDIPKPSTFGGILVSQEIKVDVREGNRYTSKTGAPALGAAVIESETVKETVTFVDELLALAVSVEGR